MTGAMTIPEWIARRERSVPDAFRFCLRAEAPASLASLVHAAEAELAAYDDAGDRTAAYALLAADAYITYACLWAVLEEDDCGTLREVAERVVRGWGVGDRR